VSGDTHPGRDARLEKGWWRACRWLLLRRASQTGVLALFLAGPWLGIWWLKGNLSGSRVLDTVTLADPYLVLQSVAARHWPEATALLGAVIVLGFYLFVGGRVYCSWVCPVNVVTDAAAWLRRRLGIRTTARLSTRARLWILLMTLVVAAVTGSIAWELVNPVSMLHRGLLFGMGLGWSLILGVFLLDLLVARRAWCGHLCPTGAFYGLLGHLAFIRVSASRREACNDCMDCFAVCPEPQVIRPALKGRGSASPVIRSAQCTNCGRCIDVCSREVFEFATRFHQRQRLSPGLPHSKETEVRS